MIGDAQFDILRIGGAREAEPAISDLKVPWWIPSPPEPAVLSFHDFQRKKRRECRVPAG